MADIMKPESAVSRANTTAGTAGGPACQHCCFACYLSPRTVGPTGRCAANHSYASRATSQATRIPGRVAFRRIVVTGT